MKSKAREVLQLESELLRLTALVRQRRAQLARLKNCPNPACPCRVVWRNHIEEGLASQVRKIRKQVRATPPKTARSSSAKGKRVKQRAG
jgi:hypothetical protein